MATHLGDDLIAKVVYTAITNKPKQTPAQHNRSGCSSHQDLRRGRFGRGVQQTLSLLSSRREWTLRFLKGGDNRERFTALRPLAACEPKDDCNSNSQAGAEGNEIPKSGKPENKDECAARRKDQADESTPEREPMHVYAGMAICGHCTTCPTAQSSHQWTKDTSGSRHAYVDVGSSSLFRYRSKPSYRAPRTCIPLVFSFTLVSPCSI